MAKARGVGLATRGYGITGKETGFKDGGMVAVKGYMRGGAVASGMPIGKSGKSSFKIKKPKPMGDSAPTMGGDMGSAELPAMKTGGLVGKTGKGQASMPGYAKSHKGVGYSIPDRGSMTKGELSVKGTKEPKKSRGA